MLTDQTVLSQPEWVHAGVVDGEHLLLHKQQGHVFRLTATGSDIWLRLQTPTSYVDLIQSLIKDYSVTREVCEPDVDAFLQQLQQRDLIAVS